jgi:hypothetical protein
MFAGRLDNLILGEDHLNTSSLMFESGDFKTLAPFCNESPKAKILTPFFLAI